MAKGHILIVDDEPSILRSLAGILGDEGFQVAHVRDGETALQFVQEYPYDLVLLDIWMPGMDGIQTLQRLRALKPGVCVIAMSGHGNIETAVKATKLGAFDYLEKPLSLDGVLSAVNAAFEHIWKTREHHWVEMVHVAREPLIGVSRAQQGLGLQIDTVAESAGPLLIVGEPGSGREFVAHLLHQRWHAMRPFIKVYCAAASEVELAQLFASDDRVALLLAHLGEIEGSAELDGGTLYLDGLERLSVVAMETLSQLMMTCFSPDVTGNMLPPLRIVAATQPSSLQDGGVIALPATLQHVFTAAPLATIPLRERPEDIPLLAEHFLRRAARQYGGIPKELHPEALGVLVRYKWPGNVKELKVTLERLAMITLKSMVGVEDLPQHLISAVEKAPKAMPPMRYASLKEARRAWERQYLEEQLRKHDWNATHVAQALQLNERSLQRRLYVLGIRGARSMGRPSLSQRTLKRSVVIHGQGLQSGVKTGMILSPLPPHSGVLFCDIATGETIPAEAAYVESTGYATTLRRGLVTARTVEHIMAALHMYHITNALVKIGGEVPFMDGSAQDFCQLIEAAGIEEQDAEAQVLPIRDRHVWGEEAPGRKHFVIEPAPHLTITYHLHYPPPIGQQEYTFTDAGPEHFHETIAPARTFGFVKEIEHLHALGMANGGRLTNVILVDESHIINTELRFPDEFVRHKVLDLLGDLYLTGRFVQGKITAFWTGHTENLALVRFLLTL
jgi:two-component system nitrogen regulation response regulator NtrX